MRNHSCSCTTRTLPCGVVGSWNGELLMGIPNMKRDMLTFNVSFTEDDNQVATLIQHV